MSDENQTQALTTTPKAPITIGSRGLELRSFDDLWRFSNYVVKSGLAPKGLTGPEAVFVAVQLGLELGLTPMSALQNIGVVNGKPGIYGDAALALVRSAGLLEKYTQEWTGKGDERKAVVMSKRRGMPDPIVSEFSVTDAKVAGLHGNGVHKTYPDRMLMFRARGFNLRDNFGDVLKGLYTVEELRDMPSIEIDATVKAEPTFTTAPNGKPELNPAPAPAPSPVDQVYALLKKSDGITEAEVMAILKRKQLCKPETDELGQLRDDVLADIIANWDTFCAQVRIDRKGAGVLV